jgi:hypothetical protein
MIEERNLSHSFKVELAANLAVNFLIVEDD